MKINHTNIYEYSKDNGTVYYATLNGVMLGTVVENVNNKKERDAWLIVGTSMAIPINEHPNNNSQFSQAGYFSTYEEATEHHRYLLVNFLQKCNSSDLKNNPIKTNELNDFAEWVDEEMIPGKAKSAVRHALDEYAAQMNSKDSQK